MTLSLFIPWASSLRRSSLHTWLTFLQILKAPSFLSPASFLLGWLPLPPQTTPKHTLASSLALLALLTMASRQRKPFLASFTPSNLDQLPFPDMFYSTLIQALTTLCYKICFLILPAHPLPGARLWTHRDRHLQCLSLSASLSTLVLEWMGGKTNEWIKRSTND